ncbi:MAG: 4Fe-4S dicluster domain-containing protein [Thermoproteota archaeon]
MFFISEDDLKRLVEQLTSERIVIAPVEKDGYFEFSILKDLAEFSLDYSNTRLPPKSIFLPQKEILFKHDPNTRVSQEVLNPAEAVLLGVRPCDASALSLLDSVLLKPPYTDPFYEARRRNTTVVSLSCIRPMEECFCNVFETGPLRGTGEDLTLTHLRGGFLAEVRTGRGQTLVNSFEAFFKEADPDSLREYEELSCKLVEGMDSRIKIDGNKLPRLEENLDEAFFQSMAQRCVECNLCSFTCPVCYCFDTEDYFEKNNYIRVKGWDTCISPLFTRMASGLDPRTTKTQVFCHRFCHKLSRIPLTFETYGCVGCGRCVSLCPTSIDIREVLRKWG